MPASPEAIREISGLGPADLSDAILTATQPLVLRGLAASWPMVQAALASDRAGCDYLRRHYQGATVGAMLGGADAGGRFFYNEQMDGFNFQPVHVKLSGVLDEIEAKREMDPAPTIYVGSTTIDTCLPGFRAENDLMLGGRDALASIWIGNRTRIAAHYDVPDNVAVVAAGRRRFTLFPPEQLQNLYIGPLDFNPAGQAISLVDFQQPDFDKFPRFAEALRHAQVAELAPGDAIFIPSMWWHHIEALSPFNVLVNYWWRSTPDYVDTPTGTLMAAFLTLRELPPAQRKAWQEIFRHYVFEADAETAAHIPPHARGVLSPLTADGARALRGQLLKKLNR
ncbi:MULTISPECIES: cupin-like domain-containing protein [unclassified Duganella]|uniref:cupin-like domain-containing protein n=1 Tax=unclassified Duganella TaxID=2636909 RepID=UPI000891E569|nr:MULTISPECIES: cupin-like domain-containing protein [unclassified Duganella]SDH15661.1 Cupin-like domain-containing protein [Duganella sp. OV458]SDK30188.1 Cupin-like domain-containing protein [Duganella sp. OV510]